MTKGTFGKEAWVAMFRTVGLDDATMGRWHHELETNWPEAHEELLVWLGVPEADIANIRSFARGPARQP